MSHNILFGGAARGRLALGVRIASRVIGATLGPQGRNVIIERSWAPPVITKDGVTVAREILLDGRHEHMGAQLVVAAARATVNAAGDGTTATSILTGDLVHEGHRLVTAGVEPMYLARGMRLASEALLQEVRAARIMVDSSEELRHVAHISCNGDAAISDAVIEAFTEVGVHGTVAVARSQRIEPVRVEVSRGTWWNKGWSHPSLMTPDQLEVQRIELVRPLVLLLGDELRSARGLVSLLEAALRRVKAPGGEGLPFGGLLIVGRIAGDALSTLAQNRGQLNVVVVTPPWAAGGTLGEAEALGDLAVITGAQVLTAAAGQPIPVELSEAAVEVGSRSLGVAEKVTVRRDRTLLEAAARGLQGQDLDAATLARIEVLRQTTDRVRRAGRDHTADMLVERTSRLAGGLAVIHGGGATDSEAEERVFRIEDAIQATRVAVESGVVSGSGAALFLAAQALQRAPAPADPAEAAGWRLVLDAAKAPLRRLAENAGQPFEPVAQALQPGCAWDLVSASAVNAWEAGILDPLLVVESALRHAVSTAASTLECEVSLHPLQPRG